MGLDQQYGSNDVLEIRDWSDPQFDVPSQEIALGAGQELVLGFYSDNGNDVVLNIVVGLNGQASITSEVL